MKKLKENQPFDRHQNQECLFVSDDTRNKRSLRRTRFWKWEPTWHQPFLHLKKWRKPQFPFRRLYPKQPKRPEHFARAIYQETHVWVKLFHSNSFKPNHSKTKIAKETTYARYGLPPRKGVSFNNATKQYEKGISAFWITFEGEYAIPFLENLEAANITFSNIAWNNHFHQQKIYLLEGNEVGIGGDGEPLLENVKVLKDDIKFCIEKESIQEMSIRYMRKDRKKKLLENSRNKRVIWKLLNCHSM